MTRGTSAEDSEWSRMRARFRLISRQLASVLEPAVRSRIQCADEARFNLTWSTHVASILSACGSMEIRSGIARPIDFQSTARIYLFRIVLFIYSSKDAFFLALYSRGIAAAAIATWDPQGKNCGERGANSLINASATQYISLSGLFFPLLGLRGELSARVFPFSCNG